MTAPTRTNAEVAALELRGITGGYGKATVLRDVDISVGQGQVVALLGANGAGKTTALRAAAGQLKPTAGTIAIGGHDQTRSACHQRVRAGLCLVPEGRGVFPRLTVRENLELQIPPWERELGIDTAIAAFPVLGERLGQLAGTLSGGQQQMLALSRAFVARPTVVMLDEVSMGLAPRVVEQIFAALVTLTEAGVALLLVEQYVHQALALADHVYVLQRGRIAVSAAPADVDEEALLKGYLGDGPSTPATDRP